MEEFSGNYGVWANPFSPETWVENYTPSWGNGYSASPGVYSGSGSGVWETISEGISEAGNGVSEFWNSIEQSFSGFGIEAGEGAAVAGSIIGVRAGASGNGLSPEWSGTIAGAFATFPLAALTAFFTAATGNNPWVAGVGGTSTYAAGQAAYNWGASPVGNAFINGLSLPNNFGSDF